MHFTISNTAASPLLPAFCFRASVSSISLSLSLLCSLFFFRLAANMFLKTNSDADFISILCPLLIVFDGQVVFRKQSTCLSSTSGYHQHALALFAAAAKNDEKRKLPRCSRAEQMHFTSVKLILNRRRGFAQSQLLSV